MSVVVTIAKGADASYPWRQIGAQSGPDRTGKPGAAYYLSPSQKGGEPPGRWAGEGGADFGFHDGDMVQRASFERLYGEFLDPRDPSGQTRLGRAPQRFQSAEEIYAALLAAEPEATAERRAELLNEAKRQVKTPTHYWDTTLSVGKSVSLLHASALVNAVRAAEQGDLDQAARWEAVATEIWECIEIGNRVFIDYLRREAGYTRTGYHGRKADGVETGRWEDAHELVVAMFPQHTSRDGEPQLHIHNLWLNRVKTESDGRWRAPDGAGFFAHKGAGAALAAFAMESELSRRAGIRWVYRPGSHGREISGVPESLMKLFSSRRVSISTLTSKLAKEFEAQHGYAPDQRALHSMRQFANHVTRQGKQEGALDLVALSRQWEAQARAAEAGALQALAPRLWQASTPAHDAGAAQAAPGAGCQAAPGTALRGAGAEPDPAQQAARPLSPAEEREVMARGLAQVQERKAAWRRADLIWCLGEQLPDHAGAPRGAQAAARLEAMASRALAGEAGTEVVCLDAPEWPRVPQALRRGDGRSVYKPHWSAQYATLAQLTLEERLLAEAQADTAPGVAPDVAARLLGSDQAQLEAQLKAQARQDHGTQARQAGGAQAQQPRAAARGGGRLLRLDQKAALWHALTSGRRVEVMVGPAGSGKTITAAEAARVWRAAGMGTAYGLATSQAARNVLADAGVTMSENTSRFLGHLRGKREALGVRGVPPGSLLILDEASMMSMSDMAAIVRTAAQRGCKVLVMGDHEQLAAVESGGGMMMLARQMGYVQLAEPVRFREEWERDATLRLRAGDTTVLREYDEHARLLGGSYEEAVEQAVRAWMADHRAGQDTLLIARTREQCREMSRRVRDELILAGEVADGPEIPLRDDARAGIGDLIIARENDRRIEAGAPGRTLANGDVLRLDAIDGPQLAVRRRLGRDPNGGERRWSAPFTLPKSYVFSNCDLAYAVTCHSAQGRTVDTAHALVDGLADRQSLYVAMSRGRRANHAYCVTSHPRIADVSEGSRAAPELSRVGRLLRERDGQQPTGQEPEPRETDAPGQRATEPLDPVAVMASSMQRDGSALSALETLRKELSDADHLGVLGAIWHDLARREQAERFERSLRDCLPAALAAQAMDDPAHIWLWRSLREAEAAGLDGAQVLKDAVTCQSLTGANDPARVVDARVRRRLKYVVPPARLPWRQRAPQHADPQMSQFINELAAAMDARQKRIGEHAANTAPLWATQALGEVPDGPAKRAKWQRRAGVLGAYREMFGYDHPGDAIGPEPAATAPEARAAWHAALAALSHVDGIDVRGLTDAQLMLRRTAYERETAWAPKYVADALRLARKQEKLARDEAARSACQRAAAERKGDRELAQVHAQLARSWTAAEGKSRRVRQVLTPAHDTRRQWEVMTEPARRMAQAADLELKRRGVIPAGEPLRSAEPEGFVYPQPPAPPREHVWVQDTLVGPAHLPERADAERTDASRPASEPVREHLGLQMLGLDAAHIQDELPLQVTELAAYNRDLQEKIDERRSIRVPSDDPDERDLGFAWSTLADRDRDAILQPPKPQIRPAAEVISRAGAQIAAYAREPASEAEPG